MVEESTMSPACFVLGGVLPFGVDGLGKGSDSAFNGLAFKEELCSIVSGGSYRSLSVLFVWWWLGWFGVLLGFGGAGFASDESVFRTDVKSEELYWSAAIFIRQLGIGHALSGSIPVWTKIAGLFRMGQRGASL